MHTKKITSVVSNEDHVSYYNEVIDGLKTVGTNEDPVVFVTIEEPVEMTYYEQDTCDVSHPDTHGEQLTYVFNRQIVKIIELCVTAKEARLCIKEPLLPMVSMVTKRPISKYDVIDWKNNIQRTLGEWDLIERDVVVNDMDSAEEHW